MTTSFRAGRPLTGALALLVAAFLLPSNLTGPSPEAVASGSAATGEGGTGRLLLVLDASGSMKEPAGGGRTRFRAAQGAVREVVRALPDEVEVGLRLYGAKVADGPGSCRDSELVVPVDSGNRRALTTAVGKAKPLGNTPLAHSLEQALGDLPEEGQRTVVLVSDGEESCGGNPCQVARDLSEKGVDLTIDVVGFQVGSAARNQLTCIAQAGRGTFYDAPNAATLSNQLERLSARAARAYAPRGIPVEGADSAEGAPQIRTGQYLDTIGDGGDVETYEVSPADGETLHVSATVRPTVASVTDNEAVELTVQGSSGSCGFFRSSSLGAFDRLTPVTAAGIVDGDELDRCGPGPYAVQVSRLEGAEVKPLELVVRAERPVEDVDSLPAAAPSASYDVPAEPGGKAQPVVGAPSFTGAPVVGAGRYTDSILVGETLFYAVEADWGQQVVCDATLRPSPPVDRALGTSAPTAEVRLFGPGRGRLSDVGLSSPASDFYEGNAAVDVHLASVPVRYRNREETGYAEAAAVPGTYYCGVLLNGSQDFSSAGEVPLTVTLDVVGEAGDGAPTYRQAASEGPPPSQSPRPSAQPDADEDSGGDAAGSGDGAGLGPVVLGAVVLLALLIGALLVLRSRRRG